MWEMGKLKHREVQCLAEGRVPSRRLAQGDSTGSQGAKLEFINTMGSCILHE